MTQARGSHTSSAPIDGDCRRALTLVWSLPLPPLLLSHASVVRAPWGIMPTCNTHLPLHCVLHTHTGSMWSASRFPAPTDSVSL
jgi:hypothetical protein